MTSLKSNFYGSKLMLGESANLCRTEIVNSLLVGTELIATYILHMIEHLNYMLEIIVFINIAIIY